MALVTPQAGPGFRSQATQVQAQGAWYGGNLVRWRFGYLEKMGGWERLFEEQFAGVIRRMHAWTDLENYKNLFVATDQGLEIAVNDRTYGLGQQLDLMSGATVFSVTAGSTTVTVTSSLPVTLGGTLVLELPISIGGAILLAPTFWKIKALVAGGFTFDMPMAALYTETNAVGIRLFTNDFINGITCTWKGHGLSVGSAVTIVQTTSLVVPGVVDFVVPAKTVVRVDSVPTADTFTFAMATLGTGDGVGGSSHQVYEGTQGGVPGVVLGFATPAPLLDPQHQNWYLDNLGENGLALSTAGPLKVYTPPIEDGPWVTVVGNDVIPPTAPQHSNGMTVSMPQAQVILWGTEAIMGDETTVDPLLIRFSDVGTFDTYTATASNQAGSYRLSRGSRIIAVIQAPQTTLIFTDTDVWSMSYVGPPLVYGFTVMGTGCGLLAPHAVRTLGRVTMWMARNNFWSVGDTGAQIMPCGVWDYVFKDIDELNKNKIHAASNSSTAEIAFFFPSRTSAIAPGGDPEGNLLLSSSDFSLENIWVPTDVGGLRIVIAMGGYVYEPQYVLQGWLTDSGLPRISWLNDDVQGPASSSTVVRAPDNSGNAFRIAELATNGMHKITQTLGKQPERTAYTFSIYAHSSSTRNLTLRAGASRGSIYATFDPVHGRVLATGSTNPAFEFVDANVMGGEFTGNGWLRYVLSFVSDDEETLDVSLELTNNLNVSYLGTNGYVIIWGAQLVFGGDPLPYQETTAEPLKTNESSRYVKVNLMEAPIAWDSGRLWRSAWIDNSIWGPPLGADINHRVQQHERGYDDDDKPMRNVFAETGYSEISDGSMMLSIHECYPDFKWFGRDGGIKLSLRALNYPGGPEHLYGPYTMSPTTQFITPRVRARHVATRYEWMPMLGYSARVGATTFRVKPTGSRP